MRKCIKLSESQLNRVILESAIRLIKEASGDYARRNYADISAKHYFGNGENNADARGIYHSRYGHYDRPDVAFNKDLTNMEFDGDDLADGMRDIDARYRRPSLDNDDELGYGC